MADDLDLEFFEMVFEKWAASDKRRRRLWNKHKRKFDQARDLEGQRNAIAWLFKRLTPEDQEAIDQAVAEGIAAEMTSAEAAALIQNLAIIRPDLRDGLPGASGLTVAQLAVSELRKKGAAVH